MRRRQESAQHFIGDDEGGGEATIRSGPPRENKMPPQGGMLFSLDEPAQSGNGRENKDGATRTSESDIFFITGRFPFNHYFAGEVSL
jgi:hypothetical protein